MIIRDEEYNIFWEWMREYIDDNCIFRQGQNEWDIDCREDKSWLPGKGNKKYGWQFYLSRGCFDSTFNSIMSQMFLYKVEKEIGHFNFQLSGLETAATPMLSAIPLVARNFNIELNSFVIRKEQKAYGLHNWVEGWPDPDLPVMIIDDLISKSSSMNQANEIIVKHMNLETLDYVFAIVNKRSEFKMDVKNLNNSTTHCETMPDKKIIYLFDCDDFYLYMGKELEFGSPEHLEILK